MKKILTAAVLGLGLATAAHAADLPTKKAPATPAAAGPFGFLYEDTQIYFAYKPFGKEPGVSDALHPGGTPIQKYIFGLTHFDVWNYGTNFFNIEFLQSDSKDPPAGAIANAGTGATEIYGVYRGTLSGNSLTGTKAFSFGPIKDISLGFGGDFNTKNTTFGPSKKLLVIGPHIDFALPIPGAVFGVSLNLAHEWNYNGIVGKAVSFRAAPEIETNYMIPLAFTGVPLRLEGYTNFVLPKGKDGFQNWSKLEINSDTKLALDIGKLAGWGRSVDVFVGYKYWLNKFGNDHSLYTRAGTMANPGSVESTVFVGASWHVF